MPDLFVSLENTNKIEIATFKKDLQKAFSIAVDKEFIDFRDEPIPSEDDLDKSLNAVGAVALHILCNGRKVGGAVVIINETTQHNSLDLFI